MTASKVSRERVAEIRSWVASSPESLAALDTLISRLISCPINLAAPLILAFTRLFSPRDGIPPVTAVAVLKYLSDRASPSTGAGSVPANITLGQADLPIALHAAAAAGDVPTVMHIISTLGASPDARLMNGSTPLQTAAAAGQAGCVVALVDAGARVNAADLSGTTALAAAVTSAGQPAHPVPIDGDVISELLARSAPSRRALCAVVYALAAAGADVHSPTADGTPLMSKVPDWLSQSLRAGSL